MIAGAWISPVLQEGKLRPGEMTDLLKVRARAGDGVGRAEGALHSHTASLYSPHNKSVRLIIM